MTDLDVGSGYGNDQILAAIVAGYRTIRFRYELLAPDLTSIRFLDNVETCKVEYNYLADVKRTATFTIAEDGQTVNWLQDLIRPYVDILMPDGLYARIPVGTFLLSTPTRAAKDGLVTRDVTAYDRMQILRQNYNATRYQIAAGANVVTAVESILDDFSLTHDIKDSPTTAAAIRAWDPGTSWGVIVNELLDSIGYGSIWFDPMGVANAKPYEDPASRKIDFTYKTDEFSIMPEEATETYDVFDVPNNWVFVVSQPDRPVLTSTYTNTSADSETSTINRGGRIITYFDNQQDAADQTTLDTLVRKKAQEDSQIYNEIEVMTALNPLHDESATIELTHDPLGVDSKKYNEMTWEMTLKAGETMKHTMRRLVAV